MAKQTREKKIIKKAVQINQGTVKELPQKNNSIPVPEESSVAFQKSNAALEIQPAGLMRELIQNRFMLCLVPRRRAWC